MQLILKLKMTFIIFMSLVYLNMLSINLDKDSKGTESKISYASQCYNKAGNNNLLLAAYNNHINNAETLIKQGVDINFKNINGFTALMYAAQCGNEEIVQMLIDAGANVNIQDSIGDTALIYAANNSNETIVQMLIDAGIDVNIKNKIGNSALSSLINSSYLSEVAIVQKIVKIFIGAGADLTIRNDKGHMALDILKEQIKGKRFEKKLKLIGRILLESLIKQKRQSGAITSAIRRLDEILKNHGTNPYEHFIPNEIIDKILKHIEA